jgi:histidinol phosphatase-like PHP family hydrolase
MQFPKMNLHSHTNFSDGKHSVKHMVKKAIKYELDFLAITDHLSNSWKSDIIPTLNSIEKITDYLTEITLCKEFLKKNSIKLRLFKGIEIDVGSSAKFIKKLVQPQNFEIIIFEYLETLEGVAFINNLIDYWKRKFSSVNFPLLGMAHLDPSNFIYNGLDRIIQLLKKYNIYFEFNTRYSQYYSRQNEIFFEKLRKYEIPVAIGSDAHYSRFLDLIDDPLDSILDYNLQNNLNILIELLNEI